MTSSFLAEMQQHRAEAVAERDFYDARVAAFDVLIAQEQAKSGVVSLPRSQRAQRGSRPSSTRATNAMTVGEAALKALAECGQPISFKVLLDRTNEVMGSDVKENTLRGTLPRLVKSGQIAQLGGGRYGLPSNDFGPADDATGPKEASDDVDGHPGPVVAGAFGASQPAR